MNDSSITIKEFTDLKVWQEGHALVMSIHKITKRFPADERFGLTDQIRRASISVTSNIAEGFGRQTYKEKTNFYYTAAGSLKEVHNQLIIARDFQYLSTIEFNSIEFQLVTVGRMLSALIKSNKLKS